MASPRPLPTAVHKARGNPRGGRSRNKREPTLQAGVPPCPGNLSPVAQEEWKRLVAETLTLGVLTVADRGILEAAAVAYATWHEAREDVARNGLILSETRLVAGGTYGKPGKKIKMLVRKTNPAAGLITASWRQYVSALTELGLTPSARTRVAAAPQETEEENKAGRYLQ